MNPYFGGSSGHVLADRRYELALQLADSGDYEAAADLLNQALELAPSWPPLHFHLGDILRKFGEDRNAVKALMRYLDLDPADKMGAMVKLVLLGERPSPETLPPGYVQSLFDQFAERFDEALVTTLKYHVPEFIAEAVGAVHTGPFDRLLDLGCGTGLAAACFKGCAAWMEGVDLSPGMIEQARAKSFYDELHVEGLEEFLSREIPAYDLVLGADVFVYIGALEHIFKQTALMMNKGALFAFSVQTMETGDWRLCEDHRYSHTKSYIERCAQNAGLGILSHDDVVVRQDAGHPVPGMIFVCGK